MGDGVRDGLVGVTVSVVVEVGEGVTVALAVGVDEEGMLVGVAEAGSVGVFVAGITTGGVGEAIQVKAISRIIPRIIKMAYLRSMDDRLAGFSGGTTTGGSPVNPKADNRLSKFSGYSPSEKLT